MIFLDLFEQDPNFRKPVEYENRKQFGTVNLANFIEAYKHSQPVQFDFPGGRSYKLSAQWVDMLGDYYNSLETNNDKAQLVYYVLTDYNKTIRLLNDLAQTKLFEKKSSKQQNDPDFKSTKLSRLKTQARARHPEASSDVEAMVADFVDSQEADQQEFDRVKSTNLKQDELLKQITAINQQQDQEISGLDSEHGQLQKNIQQLRSVNTELAKKLAAMAQRKKPKSKEKDTTEPATSTTAPTTTGTWVPPSAADTQPDWTTAAPALPQAGIPTATPATVGGQPATVLSKPKRKRRTKAEIEADRAGKAAMAAMSKMAGGKTIKPVQPNIPAAPTGLENVPPEIAKDTATIGLFPDENEPESRGSNVIDLFPKLDKLQKVAEALPAKAAKELYRWKNQQNQPQQEPAVAPAEPQPVPARLSDLQSRQQKFANLASIKKDIEALQARATRGGRILPRGLAADLEDYFTTADVDTAYEDMMAKYQKQLGALQQYLGMRKVLWSPKKDVHEMRASELEETKESKAWEDGGREGYYHRPNKNPYKPGTQEHSDYNRGYEHFKGDKDWGTPKRRSVPEDTKSELKAVALEKIKKLLNNPKLDPNTRKDYELRLHKIQSLEEGDVIRPDFRQGYNSEDYTAYKNTRGDYFDKIDRAAKAGDMESVKRLRVELKDLEDAARRRGLVK